jgi:hypothetical protein
VYDHLGDLHWRLGDREAALEAWGQAVKLLEDPEFQRLMVQQFQAIQSQIWHLLVVDPRRMYDREYGSLLERINQKLTAVEQGGQPAVAPTFAEMIPK